MTIYISFTANAKQYNEDVLKGAVISYQTDRDNHLPVWDDKTNDRGVAKTSWKDEWKGKVIYVYCNGRFVTSVVVGSRSVVDFNVDYPDRDPRR